MGVKVGPTSDIIKGFPDGFHLTFQIDKIKPAKIPARGPGTPGSVTIKLIMTPIQTQAGTVLDRMVGRDQEVNMAYTLTEKQGVMITDLIHKGEIK